MDGEMESRLWMDGKFGPSLLSDPMDQLHEVLHLGVALISMPGRLKNQIDLLPDASFGKRMLRLLERKITAIAQSQNFGSAFLGDAQHASGNRKPGIVAEGAESDRLDTAGRIWERLVIDPEPIQDKSRRALEEWQSSGYQAA
jgi:hypothetical protein